MARFNVRRLHFGRQPDADLGRAAIALHDAQSAVAREHGLKSWAELREAVAQKNAADSPPSEDLLRALMPLHFPESVGTALRDAWGRRAEVGRCAHDDLLDEGGRGVCTAVRAAIGLDDERGFAGGER